MKMQITIILFCLTSFAGFSQIVFEKGYFIDNNNQKTECLIKNNDWKSNPSKFDYKITEGGSIETKDVSNTKEFGFPNGTKYIKANLKIDYSNSELHRLTPDKNPDWVLKEIFLKVILEGEANLYYFEDANLRRIFYSVKEAPIEQLVYKTYEIGGKILENKTFLAQLNDHVDCNGLFLKEQASLKYDISYLKKYFEQFNICKGIKSRDYSDVIIKRQKFAFKIAGGGGFSNLHLSTYYTPDLANIKGRNFNIGLELAYFLPFNRNKWSIFLNPKYVDIKGEGATAFGLGDIAHAKLRSLEFDFGIRHFFYINDKSKIFLDASFIYDKQLYLEILSSRVIFDIHATDRNQGFKFGAGYDFKNINIAIRYTVGQNGSPQSFVSFDTYQNLSLILGYVFVKKSIK